MISRFPTQPLPLYFWLIHLWTCKENSLVLPDTIIDQFWALFFKLFILCLIHCLVSWLCTLIFYRKLCLTHGSSRDVRSETGHSFSGPVTSSFRSQQLLVSSFKSLLKHHSDPERNHEPSDTNCKCWIDPSWTQNPLWEIQYDRSPVKYKGFFMQCSPLFPTCPINFFNNIV